MTNTAVASPPPAHAQTVEQLARTIFDECLVHDGSILSPGRSIWTAENLAELHSYCVEALEPTGRTFAEKLDVALADASDDARQLLAELYVLALLPVTARTFGKSTKMRFVSEVLAPIRPDVEIPADVEDALADGVLNIGRPSPSRRWAHLAFLIGFAEYVKQQDVDARRRAGSDPATLRRFVTECPGESDSAQRHALMYLLQPQHFPPTIDRRRLDAESTTDGGGGVTEEAVQTNGGGGRLDDPDLEDLEESAIALEGVGVKYAPMAPGTYRIGSGWRTAHRPGHRGLDLEANVGTPIYAPSDGFLVHVGINDDPTGFGSWLWLDSQAECGLDFAFGHMPPSSIVNPDTGRRWSRGERVRAGQQIAVVGNEGSSTGPHLHFETFGPPGRTSGPDRNPMEWLTGAADPRTAGSAAVIRDPDAWPLPQGVFWGPLEGPEESWSNLAGTEPQFSKDGLRRWQEALGLPGSGVYDAATRAAATRMQQHFGWPVTGNVYPGEWDKVIREGWRLPAQAVQVGRPPERSRDGYALAIIEEGIRRGITERGIKIALSTALVETQMIMYANSKDPASLRLPHDRVGSDGMSVGLFQQQNFAEWGSLQCRMDPACSAGKFYEHLVRFDYNSPAKSPGTYAADVQRPAAQFRGRYDERFGEASDLYARLIGFAGAAVTPADPDAWPLPPGVYWGPLEGPDESWSNLTANAPQYSKDGLKRWQMALGLPGAGVYDDATRAAAIRMQQHFGWPVTGNVYPGEWDHVIREGWRLPAQDPAAIATGSGYPIHWYPGPGFRAGHNAYLRIYLHTTESQDWITRAENVADFQTSTKNSDDAGSYHFLVDDEHIINTVATKDTAWGVLSDNNVSVQIAMVGTSGEITKWTGRNPNVESRPKRREQWLEHTKMLDMVAFVIATVARDYAIPVERVDITGVGQNRRGVSSHHNYTFGSVKLRGFKDGTHWDVPDTFPWDVVLDAAKRYVVAITDPDRFPLPPGHYWGPLDGPAESWSNMFGNEPQSSKDGLRRWQEALGLPGSSVYDDATRDAATRMQQVFGWPVTGRVYEGEWNEVIRRGWRLPAHTEAVEEGFAFDEEAPGGRPWQLDDPLMRGPEVATIKDKLVRKFAWARDKFPTLTERTEFYDQATAAAIKEFQFRVALPANGIADTATLVRLGVVTPTRTTTALVATVPGTWAGWNDGPPAWVAWGLDAGRFRQQGVAYPAMGFLSPDPNVSYNESRDAGTEELLRLSLQDAGPKVWIGYSQGADVIVRALHRWPAERRPEIRAVVTFGSPGRRPGPTLLGNDPEGAGISGVFTPDWAAARTWDFCIDGDMYCNAVGLLPTLYDILTRMELSADFAMYLFQILTSDVGAQLMGTAAGGGQPGAGVLSGVHGLVTHGPLPFGGGQVSLQNILFNLPAIIQTLGAALRFVITGAHGHYHDQPLFDGMSAVDRARRIITELPA